MARFGMVIDLKRCIGCCGCVVTCKAGHSLPQGIFWGRVLMKEYGKFPNVGKLMVPVLCNHCKDAACVRVCPAGATKRRDDGIILVDYNKCIGCRYCMMACPYGARSFLARLGVHYPGHGLRPYEELGHKKLEKGVVTKCTFCAEKIDEGLKKGLKPGVDWEATPSCVNNCMARARYFGDLDDADSEVSRLIWTRKAAQQHPEFGTEPSVYYLT